MRARDVDRANDVQLGNGCLRSPNGISSTCRPNDTVSIAGRRRLHVPYTNLWRDVTFKESLSMPLICFLFFHLSAIRTAQQIKYVVNS
jgi:hypothetical protein